MTVRQLRFVERVACMLTHEEREAACGDSRESGRVVLRLAPRLTWLHRAAANSGMAKLETVGRSDWRWAFRRILSVRIRDDV